jgi:hypothetical protein
LAYFTDIDGAVYETFQEVYGSISTAHELQFIIDGNTCGMNSPNETSNVSAILGQRTYTWMYIETQEDKIIESYALIVDSESYLEFAGLQN